MHKRYYLLFFSFFLLSGNPQSFAAGKDDSLKPLLQDDRLLGATYSAFPTTSTSIQDGASEEGRRTAQRSIHCMADSVETSSLEELLSRIDTTAGTEGFTHLIDYIYFVKGRKIEEEERGGKRLEKEDKKAKKAKGEIITKYRAKGAYISDVHLEGHLMTNALAALGTDAPLSTLFRKSTKRVQDLQGLVRRFIEKNHDLEEALGEVQQQLRESQATISGLQRKIQQTSDSRQETEEAHQAQRLTQQPVAASTTIQIGPTQTADMPDQQGAIESLVRSNQRRCYVIGGGSAVLGLIVIYSTWLSIHAFH